MPPANPCLIRELFSKPSTNFLKFFFSVLTANFFRISFDSQSTTNQSLIESDCFCIPIPLPIALHRSLAQRYRGRFDLPPPTLPFSHQASSACQSLCLLFPILATYNLCISSSFPIPFHFISRLFPTFHPSSLPRLSAHRPFLLLLLKKSTVRRERASTFEVRLDEVL